MAQDPGLARFETIRPSALDGRVEIARGEPAPWVLPASVSKGLGICVKQGSSHEVMVNGRRTHFPARSIAVHGPGCLWASCDGVHGFLSVAIAPELLPEAQIEATMGFLRAGALPDLPRVAGRLTTAESALEAEVLITELVTLVLESKVLRSDGADLSPGRRSVVEAQEFLRVSLGARPGLDDLAKAVGVNKFTLLKRFREAVGTTPYAYLRLLRLATARDRLAAGGAPAEVAFETGFSDQSHLGRDFRRAYGVTPAAYARQARSTHLIGGTRDNGGQDKRRVISPGAELS
jgi:AraC-like DNA-binding protein